MSRPEVTLENYQEVFDFYGNYTPSPLAKYALHSLIGFRIHPIVEFADGAEEQLLDIDEQDGQVAFAPTHVSTMDPFTLVATVKRTPSLRPFREDTFVVAKHPLFHKLVQRYLIDLLNANPAFRLKDQENDDARTLELYAAAGKLGLETYAEKINRGQNIALFPGEERAEDPLVVPPLKHSLGRVLNMVSVKQPAIVPMGFHYTEEDGQRRPYVYVGNLSRGHLDRREVNPWLHPRLQDCVDHAVAMSLA